ncbi:MAG: HEPN domain-containing protein [Bacteroidia bacterium]
MTSIENIYNTFKQQAESLKELFIDSLPSAATLLPIDSEQTYIKAFIVLFHACLEDFFEQISLELIRVFKKKYEEKNFVNPNDTGNVTQLNEKIKSQLETYLMIVSFAAHHGSKKLGEDFKDLQSITYIPKEKIEPIDLSAIKTTAEYVSNLLTHANTVLTKKFAEDNHGASLPYMTEMLTAVGIDVNKNLTLQNALRLVAYYRGDYAHKGVTSRIDTLLDKTTAETHYDDCMLLCEDIYEKAIRKI